jgi:hypothetical protein
MSFFDVDPERPRLKFKDSDPFGQKEKVSDPQAENADNESHIRAAAAEVPPEPKEKDVGKENEVRGIATEGARKKQQSVSGIRPSASKLLPKRVTFFGEKSKKTSQLPAAATTATTTKEASLDEPGTTESMAMDVAPANEEVEAAVPLPAGGVMTSSSSSTSHKRQTIAEQQAIDKPVLTSISSSSSSSSSTSTVSASQEIEMEMEAMADDIDMDEEEDEDTSDRIMATVTDQQACVTKEVEDFAAESTRLRKEQALATAHRLASDPLVAISKAVHLQHKQKQLQSTTATLVGVLEEMIVKEEAGEEEEEAAAQQ